MLISVFACNVVYKTVQAVLNTSTNLKRRKYEHLRYLCNNYNETKIESQYALLAYVFHLLSLDYSGDSEKENGFKDVFHQTFNDKMFDDLTILLIKKAKNNITVANKLCDCLLEVENSPDESKEYRAFSDKLYCNLLDNADNNADLADRLLDYLIQRLEHDATLKNRLFEKLKTCQITYHK